MVRVKAKKQKGDDAFAKRKQKVGRKKLAPATATRAEIHARTLRLNSSSVLSRASEALRNEGKTTRAQAQHLEKHKSNTHDSKMAATITIMCTFSELMANTHHYKASQRASAFASLQRLLQEQAIINANKSTTSEAARMAEHQTLFNEQEKKYGRASVGGSGSDQSSKSNVITPLEQLRGFAAALEALTDTEAEVRIAALRAIDTFLMYEWQTTRHAAAGINKKEEEEEYKQQQQQQHHYNKENKSCDNNVKYLFSLQKSTEEDSKSIVDGVVLEQVVAIVQMAYITLTHALRGVRMSAIQLLSILVKHVPSTLLIREAVFRVYAQQQIHTTTTITTASMNTSSFSLTEHANKNDHVTNSSSSNTSNNFHTVRSENNSTSHANTNCALVSESRCGVNNNLNEKQQHHLNNNNCKENTNSTLKSIEDAEVERDKWICSLLSRVSALVLRSEYVHLLLSLLRLFFSSSSFRKHNKNYHHHQHEQAQNLETSYLECMSYDQELEQHQESVVPNDALRHPEIVAEVLLQDVLPKWTSAWKEVMELQALLLRQRDKLEQAICLAECFGVMLTFLKEHEVYSRQCRHDNVLLHNKRHLRHIHDIDFTRTKQAKAFIFFNRTQLEFFQHVLLIKVPITMKELLEKRNDNVIDSNLRARFAMALANICVPLANTDEGWKLLQQYFIATLASVKNDAQSNKGNIQVQLTSKHNCQEMMNVNKNKSQQQQQQQQQQQTVSTTLINFIDIYLRLVHLYKLTNSTLSTITTSKANMSSTTSSSITLNHAEIIYKINNKVVQLLPPLIDAIMCTIDAEITSLAKVEQSNQKYNSNTTICNNNYFELHLLFKSLIILLTYCTTLPVPFYLESTSNGASLKGKADKEENINDNKKQKCTKAGISLLYTLSQIPRLLFGLGQLASSLSSSEQQYSNNSDNQKNDNNDAGYINACQQEVQENNYNNNNNFITSNAQHEKLVKSKVDANISNGSNVSNYNNSELSKIYNGHTKIADTQNHESDLMNHIDFVDDVVFSLLELLWSLVGSGHCLMFAEYTEMLHLLHNNRKEKQVQTSTNNTKNSNGNNDNNNNDEDYKTKTDLSLFNLLQRSVPSLFGMAFDNTVMTGVLVWCNERTVNLARHLLFYLHNNNCDRVVIQKTEYVSKNSNNYSDSTQNQAKQNIETSIADMALLLETILEPEDENAEFVDIKDKIKKFNV